MRSAILSETVPRTWVLVFETGEEAKSGIREWAASHEVDAASFTAIGAFARATLAWYDLGAKEYLDIPVDDQVEVLTLAGNVSLSPEGDAFVHMHVTCGRKDGSTIGGHVQNAIVRPTLEVVVSELPRRLQRRQDKVSGLALLDLG
jgi:uncharacterized protein